MLFNYSHPTKCNNIETARQLLEQIERMRFESAHQLAALSAQIERAQSERVEQARALEDERKSVALLTRQLEEANGSVREKNACIESVH